MRVGFGWPLGRWVFPSVGALVALTTWLATRALLSAPYQVWATSSGAWHETLWPSGAGLVAIAALLAVLITQRGSAITLPLRARVSPVAVAAHGVSLAGWAVLGHMLGMIPLMVATATTATAGSLRIADVLIGLGGIVQLTTVGFAVGAAVRHWLVVPAAGLVTLEVMGLANAAAWRPLALLQPVQQWQATPRFVPSVWTTLFTVTMCVVATLAGIVLAGYFLNRDSVGRGVVYGWVAAPLVLTVLAFGWRPEFYRVADQLPAVCGQANGARVCLHQAYAKSFDDVLATTAALQQAGTAPLLTSVLDIHLANYHYDSNQVASDRSSPPGEVLVWIDVVPPPPDTFAPPVPAAAADQITETLFLEGCFKPGIPNRYYDIQQALRLQVLRNAGFEGLAAQLDPAYDEAAVKAVADLSPDQVADVIAQHAQQIRQCRLEITDLAPPTSP